MLVIRDSASDLSDFLSRYEWIVGKRHRKKIPF